MKNLVKQSAEQKMKQKMKMILNNLEQQLCYNKELCQDVAKIIDMSVEMNELVSRLEEIETNIPTIEQRISKMIDDCVLSCAEHRKNTTIKIYDIYSTMSGEPKAAEKLMKIHRAIEYCIANYSIYMKSEYYAKYSDGKDITKNTSIMEIEDLIKL